mgnify:CR=1 FL=1
MCAACDVGYFKAFGQCLPCISPAGNIVVMLVSWLKRKAVWAGEHAVWARKSE